jgi:hypothetical protein
VQNGPANTRVRSMTRMPWSGPAQALCRSDVLKSYDSDTPVPGLVPGIHVLKFLATAMKTWVAGTSPATG